MKNNIWKNHKKPIVGLAPMDGITDAAFRYIVDKCGQSDIMYTEFISVARIVREPKKILNQLLKYKTKTPLIIQLFGSDPILFYTAAVIVAKKNFAGIDINMGCPDNNVVKKGGGAALILRPKLARELILSIKRAVQGKIPVSVKTRIGYDKIITEKWISELLKVKPDAICVHGRTLKQKYSGQADWLEIKKAALLARKTNTIILGNGDVKSIKDAYDKSKKYKVHGILIGRAALGNPWIFRDTSPSQKTRFKTMIEHCIKFGKYRPDLGLSPMRKHLAWYYKGFEGSAKIRDQLMHINTIEEVKAILSTI